MSVIFINADKIRPLRNLVLRPGKPISSTHYDLDNHKNTFHLAILESKKIVCIGTFYPENFDRYQSKNAYRLRGMATHPNFRRKGFGAKLLNSAINEVKKREGDLLWCNARLIAVDFYSSLGFKITGNEFDIKDIGPHYIMYKKTY